ncbi:DUF2017 family protein [Georgenia sp. MJ206]|uniref:DUF2017 family protein n=1 Tax=Georgenia wangjunii TaxID=3117730 RepID=UPI002F262D94
MHAFVVVPGGLACQLEPAELRIIARVVADTAELLGTSLEESAGALAAAAPPSAGAGGPSGSAPAPESHLDDGAGEAAVLAALDWDPAGEEVPTDPALARLFPPASTEDEALAGEMRRLTEGSLRAEKVGRLALVWSALRASSGVVVVRDGTEPQWLAALNDVRLVLSARLGIEDEHDAEAVYGRTAAGEPEDEADALESALASLYTALTWWQESLLDAMSTRGRGH